MNKPDLESYEIVLQAIRQELMSYISDNVSKIELRQQLPDVVAPVKNNSLVYPCCIGIGALLLIIGAATKTNLVTIGGLVVAGVGIFGMTRRKVAPATDEKINYSALTNSVYGKLEDIHKKVTRSWDNKLIEQKDKLKNELLASDLTPEQKDKAMNYAVSRSIIQFSMMDVLSELNRIERMQDVEKYCQYKTEFIKKYHNAIDKAYNEQYQRYESIKECLD